MAKIKTKYPQLNDAELLLKGTSIVTAMTGNQYFTAPIPPLAEVSTALTAFDAALQKMVNGGKENTIIKNMARAVVENLLYNLGLYIQIESNGDELMLQSTGYDVIVRRTSIGVLSKPTNFVVKATNVSGSVKLSLQAIDGAKSYNFEYTEGPVTNDSVWISISSSKASVTLSNLSAGQQYFYRVVGVGTNPTKVYSDVISSYVS